MRLSATLRLLPLLGPALAQSPTVVVSSTVVVMPTPVEWYDAVARCADMGLPLHHVPTSTSDPVYDVLDKDPGERYWISRRHGASCTCLTKNGSGDWLEEAPCGDLLPVVCGG
jgi:hypothetical protein